MCSSLACMIFHFFQGWKIFPFLFILWVSPFVLLLTLSSLGILPRSPSLCVFDLYAHNIFTINEFLATAINYRWNSRETTATRYASKNYQQQQQQAGKIYDAAFSRCHIFDFPLLLAWTMCGDVFAPRLNFHSKINWITSIVFLSLLFLGEKKERESGVCNTM